MSPQDFTSIKTQLADSSRKLADLTAILIYEKPELLKSFIEVSWLDTEPWSQRASRVVSICCCNYPELIEPYVSDIIRRIRIQKSEGSRRNFLKIFSDSAIKLKSRDTSLLLNACFDFLTGNYSIAVKVYSMDILYKMSRELPDLGKEIYAILTDQIDDASPGFRSHALKIIKKLEKTLSFHKSGISAGR